jgi:uncharacterized membrane protein
MDKMRIPFIFLLLISFSMCTCVYADDSSYSMPSMHTDLFVQDDGSLHVKELIHYSFSGTYHGVYRDIPLSNGQSIENIKVSTQGAYSSYQVTNNGSQEHITIYLYSDPGKTTPITDADVNVTIEYDFLHGIKIYNDVADLQYKLWGEGWQVPVGQLTASVHLKSSQGVEYWLNPPYFAKQSGWDGNVFEVSTNGLDKGKYFEVRMAIPRNQFASNPRNGVIINQDCLPTIEKIQNDYQNSLNFQNALNYLLTIVMIFLLFIPILIYMKLGKEPKIDYMAEYERDIPTNDPPAVVNAICVHGVSKGIGEPDMNGFRATIMDLINRGYLQIGRLEKEKSFKDNILGKITNQAPKHSVYLQFNDKKDFSKLENFETDVVNILRQFEVEGKIRLEDMGNDLKEPDVAERFRNNYDTWEYDLKKRFLTDEDLSQIFDKKGDSYLKIYAVAGLILAVVVGVMTFGSSLPSARYPLYAAVALGAVALISLKLPEGIAGRWTTQGEEYDAKWKNFRKYLKDFSLIKEYPPESIAVWNRYLVYATALGVAENVRNAMEINLPKEDLEVNDIYLFHYYGGYMLLNSALNAGMTAGLNSDAVDALGGFGDIGGGFGGGGGGAF